MTPLQVLWKYINFFVFLFMQLYNRALASSLFNYARLPSRKKYCTTMSHVLFYNCMHILK